MKLAFLILTIGMGVLCAQLPTKIVTNKITVTTPPDGSVTELHIIPRTNALPVPPPTPLSVQMRTAMQEARGKAAPWTQRFIAIKVEQDAKTREDGVFSTNYIVTWMSVPNGTNAMSVWGTFTLPTQRPTKKGDEFDFYPVQGND